LKFGIHLNYSQKFRSDRTHSYSMEDGKSIPLNEINPYFLIIIQNPQIHYEKKIQKF